MNRDYYKDYFDIERNHWWFKVRTEILKMLLKKYIALPENSALKILNIGAATGASTKMLEEFGEVTSVEYDKECCDFLETNLGIKAINGSILDLPFEDDAFHIVCAFDVIEHVEDDQRAIDEMLRVTSNKGTIFITVPAFMFLWSNHDTVNHHFRRYTKRKILQLINKERIEILFKSYFNFILFFPIATYRIIFAKILPKKKTGTGSDFDIKRNSHFISKILYKFFIIEKYILQLFSLPIGVSFITILKKR